MTDSLENGNLNSKDPMVKHHVLGFFKKLTNWLSAKGFLQNPFFYFGSAGFVLLAVMIFNSSAFAASGNLAKSDAVFLNPFFTQFQAADANDLFFSKSKVLAMETPDLKIIQDGFIYGISTPLVLTTQTLGDIFGAPSSDNRDVVDYTVQPGDTIASVAQSFSISANTLMWANHLSSGSALKTGQTLVVLPVSGLMHVVKPGDTVSDISKKYKAKAEDIISFNNLANEGDVFVGDILIIPGGLMPVSSAPISIDAPLADSFFIYPAEGRITQGLHYYNAVDLANKCGTPIYAAAAGMVQRAVGNGRWNLGMGNYITILHTGGISTYYGHVMTLFVKPGDRVNVGDRIALMGQTGNATGCHVHFEVIGAKNPLAKYSIGTTIQYK